MIKEDQEAKQQISDKGSDASCLILIIHVWDRGRLEIVEVTFPHLSTVCENYFESLTWQTSLLNV